jgi:hypothetical protein
MHLHPEIQERSGQSARDRDATSWPNPNVEEYVHIQQVPALVDDEPPTVLERSLVEAAADFVAELISGGVSYAYFSPG